MNWNALSAFAEMIGAIGTIVGLALVYIQIRNLVNNQHAITTQNIVSHEKELWRIILDDDSMIDTLATHLGFEEDFLKEQNIRPRNAIELILFFRQYENIYYQHIHKMLPPKLWEQWVKSMEHTFKNRKAREVLRKSKTGFSEDFRKFIQDEVFPRDLT